ncbi:PREDICTED: protein BPS1, chloroplastic-like [Tarenaya hassleriana]|uniref:protein BPS1, chloroplastic-like n=1 Tax=Tarenaya hassleriana TaxID=28532 RepID=UPI00053C4BAD|nr:PREDICTED: protein BPS1, chloroplastic-like [Tarenaya hassleriana]XP_010544399.1 PREDICTED: protein BPS1, chloroplastic-like [Tarenaya hassleriana]XP_010544400.1 PREDICTED: protein BPS1, chloroplastic-like [Tarenaya hassleriana]XP_019058465.1 PREDICTED: protein BPS1, chloroplastic-like [Tarenaya hassleriana]
MSRPQDPPRGFFPFGNPFKILSPKNADLSSKLLSLLNSFEVNLADTIRKLIPKHKKDILTFSWMKQAMESLCETHKSIKTLITDLELPVSAWEDEWIDVYLDISVKLLDLCNAFSSELTRLNQGHLSLQFALHNLETNCPKNLLKARSSLDSWRQHIVSRNQRIENCHTILNSLVGSLTLPKVKNSAKGKVLMRALYGVKVKTLYISGVFAAAFSGSSQNLLYISVSDELPWAEAFTEMQLNINAEIKNIFLSGGLTVLKEVEAVEVGLKKLYPGIEDGSVPIALEPLKNSVTELSEGLDLVSNEVDSFFKIVLSGRDALLGNIRSSGALSPKRAAGKNFTGQKGVKGP